MMVKFAAYVLYVNRPDLLDRALLAFPELWTRLTIIDNSGYVEDYGSGGPVTYFRPSVPLTYTQSMNWLLHDSEEKGAEAIIHFHSDAYSENPDATKELLEAVEKARGSRWGCLWTYYDILWAINPVAVREIGGWDTNFAAYFSDNDLRRRLELAGYECIDTHIKGINHEGSATINSDPELKFMNGVTFPLYHDYYLKKWGGEPGKEKFSTPFNRSIFGI